MIQPFTEDKDGVKTIVEDLAILIQPNTLFEDTILSKLNEIIEVVNKLEKRNKEIYEGFMATTDELCDTTKALEKAYERINGLEVASSKLDYEATIYANRIDKAIEYIEHAQNYGSKKNTYVNGNDLLEILKGEDK